VISRAKDPRSESDGVENRRGAADRAAVVGAVEAVDARVGGEGLVDDLLGDPEEPRREPPAAGRAFPAPDRVAAGATEGAAAGETSDGAPEEELPRLEGERLRACLEALLFATPEPLSRRRLYRLLPEADPAAIRDALLELEGELRSTHRGYFLVEEAAGFRLLTQPEFAPFVARLRGERRRIRLSAAAFESLAVIAYRQPVRRADLEAIRGVQSMAILKNLMEWNLIKVIGHDDSPGRPLLYGTTNEFLELIGLSSLEDLPEPERLRERGEDRGLEVLDRIIVEGGGAPSLAAEAEEGDEPRAELDPSGASERGESLARGDDDEDEDDDEEEEEDDDFDDDEEEEDDEPYEDDDDEEEDDDFDDDTDDDDFDDDDDDLDDDE